MRFGLRQFQPKQPATNISCQMRMNFALLTTEHKSGNTTGRLSPTEAQQHTSTITTNFYFEDAKITCMVRRQYTK